ncbi:MAG: hypothetical protein ACYS14_09655 [Planctomycetota bacterium]|jgi:hypothetical protein
MSLQPPELLLPGHEAFLLRDPVDRPLLGAWVGGYYPAEQFPQGHNAWRLGQELEPADVRFDAFRDDYEALYRTHLEADDDFFYVGSAYWGIPWLEAILGCPIHVGETSCWAATLPGDSHRQWSSCSEFRNNPWLQCLAEFTEDLLKFADGRFPICPPLLRGPGDVAAALKGPEPIVMAMLERAKWVGEFLTHCAETRLGVVRQLHGIIPSWSGTYAAGGYPSKLWARRPVSYYQDDFAALLNPELFAEYLLLLARMTKPTAEVHFIHLHSSCLYMLDALLADDTFSVIEVNLDHPDSGPALGEYVPALKRIQEADRPLLLWGEIDQEGWSLLQRELEPAGLSIQPIVKHPKDILSYR